jgi:hypothetical protein
MNALAATLLLKRHCVKLAVPPSKATEPPFRVALLLTKAQPEKTEAPFPAETTPPESASRVSLDLLSPN